MSQEPTKERFFEILHKASQPQRSASSKTKASWGVGGSSGKQTRQRKTVNASLKRRGKFRQ